MTQAIDPEPPTPNGARWKRLLPLAILLAGLVAFFALGLHRVLTFQALHDHRNELTQYVAEHRLLAPLAALAIYALVVAFSLPLTWLMTPVCGFLFGLAGGTAIAEIGATMGATCVFLAARSAFSALFRRRLGGTLQRVEDGFRRNAFSYLLFLRLVPLFPFWLVNVVPAFFRMRLGTYVLATAIGIMPGALVFTSIGSGLGSLLDRNEQPDLSILWQPAILLPILGLALLSLVPVLYRLWKTRPTGG